MQYTIKPGDTLSKIGQNIGVDWREIAKINPQIKNPNLIYAGATLNLPDATPSPIQKSPSSLAGTMPNSQTNTNLINTSPIQGMAEQNSPVVPGGKVGDLEAIKILSKMMGEIATKQGVGAGLKETMGSLQTSAGFAPEKVSGSMIDKIINFTEGQVVDPIKSKMEIMRDSIDSISKNQKELESKQGMLRDDARQQIQLAISSDMWNSMTQQQRSDLWKGAGYTGEPILSKKKATSESKSEEKESARKDMIGRLKAKAGSDGYVSPSDWKWYMDQWIDNVPGADMADFKSNFGHLVNPQMKSKYAGYESSGSQLLFE